MAFLWATLAHRMPPRSFPSLRPWNSGGFYFNPGHLRSFSLVPSIASTAIAPHFSSSLRRRLDCPQFLLSRCWPRHTLPRSTVAPFSTAAVTMGSIQRITEHLEKPELDDRSYRVIRLSNKLEALLVHDPETDKASASVNVNVGNFSDADDMPGMAHAVEHLLFMGTKKVGCTYTCRTSGFLLRKFK